MTDLITLVMQQQEPMTSEDREALKELLTYAPMRKALHEVLKEADTKGTVLLGTNLGTPEGISFAQRTQGEASGLTRAVELLVELTYKESDNG